jgi:hypothetical protein
MLLHVCLERPSSHVAPKALSHFARKEKEDEGQPPAENERAALWWLSDSYHPYIAQPLSIKIEKDQWIMNLEETRSC